MSSATASDTKMVAPLAWSDARQPRRSGAACRAGVGGSRLPRGVLPVSEREVSLDAVRLRSLLEHDPTTGMFRWRVDRGGTARKGRVAGKLRNDGYIDIKVDGQLYLAHRLAWLYVNGEWPSNELDHRNRCRSDNRFENLRLSNDSLNQANRPYPSTLGLPRGVSRQTNGRYKASISRGSRKQALGTFDTPQEAHAAYLTAARAAFGDHLIDEGRAAT